MNGFDKNPALGAISRLPPGFSPNRSMNLRLRDLQSASTSCDRRTI